MKFEDFVEVHEKDSPCQKLLLLMENECYRRDDAVTAERDRLNGNENGEVYMRSEEKQMALRCEWLYREIVVALRAAEERPRIEMHNIGNVERPDGVSEEDFQAVMRNVVDALKHTERGESWPYEETGSEE